MEELEEKLEQTKQEAESALDEFIKAKKQEKRLRLHCKQMESRLGELEFRNSDSHIEKLEIQLGSHAEAFRRPARRTSQ